MRLAKRLLWQVRRSTKDHVPALYWRVCQCIPRLQPRRFQAYCIGTNKSGTHSLANLFAKHYRSAHEPLVLELIDQIAEHEQGTLSVSPEQYLKGRDRELYLELESNHLLIHFLDDLYRSFPDAKYIFTIRDCYSWINSAMNQQLVNPSSKWAPIARLRYASPGCKRHKAERKLTTYGLHSVSGYFSYWTHHNRKVLHTLPADRLLIVRTHEISESLDRIADFLDIPVDTIDRTQSHSYQRKDKPLNILNVVKSRYLEEQALHFCNDIMNEFFPEIDSPKDVLSE